mmetsp:Transcript_13253/g.24850  ORF Transcript_13253/g.24850 Transcript_13253/m.24850 type:complete len:187 (-) Transcript_13253:36-596(-)
MLKNLNDGQWDGYQSDVEDYKAYVNPSLVSEEGDMITEWEKCPSLPDVEAKVERLKDIEVDYIRDDGEFITEKLTGFPGRVFQHELDHVWGFLISSYTVSEGHLKFKGPYVRAKAVAETFKAKAEEARTRLEQRLLADKTFKEEAEASGDSKGFISRRVLDEEFETDFSSEFYEAMLADIKSTARK